MQRLAIQFTMGDRRARKTSGCLCSIHTAAVAAEQRAVPDDDENHLFLSSFFSSIFLREEMAGEMRTVKTPNIRGGTVSSPLAGTGERATEATDAWLKR